MKNTANGTEINPGDLFRYVHSAYPSLAVEVLRVP